MNEKPKLHLDFFPSFQNKDAYFDRLMDNRDMVKKIMQHYLFLNVLLFIYGLVMGCYNSFQQAISAGLKMPILFTLVLIICFPAFFMIQYVLGSKLRIHQIIAMLLAGNVLTAAIMVSFAPIVIFFLLSGSNYHFLKMLHVGIFFFSGFFGMKTIIEAMEFACEKRDVYPKTGVRVFRVWIVVMAFVGMQLSWILRPFIGNKGEPFQIFRTRGGNVYTSLFNTMGQLLSPTQPMPAPPPHQPASNENQGARREG